MSNNIRLSIKECQNIREGLTLALNSDEKPFALTEKEEKLGPDDWAWLFLSMSEEYKSAYDAHANSSNESKFSKYLKKESPGNIYIDHDGICRKDFGLAAWLSPTLEVLPELKNKKDSWFAPLKSVIPEDHLRKTISNDLYTRPTDPHSGNSSNYPYHIIQETPFGYHTTGLPFFGNRVISYEWGLIAFAIDCSIPPDGQIASLKNIANRVREILKDHNKVTDDKLNDAIILDIKKSDVFKDVTFEMAKGAEDNVEEFHVLWRSVYINALGPVTTQVNQVLHELKKVHQKLQEENLAKHSPRLRFKNSLVSVRDSDGKSRNGGSYLKCLFVIAELVSRGREANQIAQIVGINHETGVYKNNWERHLHENIDDYMTEAAAMINGGYRLLIHAQKPDT